MVTAYEDDELAHNSDDKKQLHKAEREMDRLSKRKWEASFAAANRKVAATGKIS